jgi:hypothetical protein
MYENGTSNGEHLGDQLPGTSRQVKVNRKRRATPGEKPGKPNSAQLTIQCPREIVAIFDGVSSRSGVNRQQLFREALEAYAALLERGMRSWRDPTLRE